MAQTRRALTDEQREQRRAQQRELVVASIEQLRTSEGWQAYLERPRPIPVLQLAKRPAHPVPAPHRRAGRRLSRVAGIGLLRNQGEHRDPDLGAVRSIGETDAGVA